MSQHLTSFLLPTTDISAPPPRGLGTSQSTCSSSSAQLMSSCQFSHCPRMLSLGFPNTSGDFLLDGMFGIWAFSLNTVSIEDVSSFVLEVIFHHLFSPEVLAPWAFLPSCCWPYKYYVPGELLGRWGRGGDY